MIFFLDADEEYQQWITSHKSDGYVIGCDRWPKQDSLMRLHHAGCRDVTKMQAGLYSKACSTDRRALIRWANDIVHGNLVYCLHCHPPED